MARPRLLDLFRGEGGAAEGYVRAGWDVTGVDIQPLGHRGPGEFIMADALNYVARFGRQYDAIHASPPCQGYSIATAGNPEARAKHDRLIAATRELLVATDRPWVIENVEQAASELSEPIMLCGRMFSLEAIDDDGQRLVLDRHRLFESNVPLSAPPHPAHNGEQVGGVYGGSRHAQLDKATLAGLKPAYVAVLDKYAARVERGGGYVPRSKAVKQALLGIDWMTVNGMNESIPPVYAEWVGNQLMDAVRGSW